MGAPLADIYVYKYVYVYDWLSFIYFLTYVQSNLCQYFLSVLYSLFCDEPDEAVHWSDVFYKHSCWYPL